MYLMLSGDGTGLCVDYEEDLDTGVDSILFKHSSDTQPSHYTHLPAFSDEFIEIYESTPDAMPVQFVKVSTNNLLMLAAESPALFVKHNLLALLRQYNEVPA